MKNWLLMVGLLFWIASASVSLKCKPRPFGCYAYEWENEINKHLAIKHAFLTDQWYRINCFEKPCNDECPSDFKFKADNIEHKGLSVSCNISIHFCNYENPWIVFALESSLNWNVLKRQYSCIAPRIVKVRLGHSSTSAQPHSLAIRVRHMAQQMMPVTQKVTYVNVKAMVLPICRLGEQLNVCKTFSGSSGDICMKRQMNAGIPISGTSWCTSLEAAFGGEYPESVINETVEYAKPSNIWKSTGLPYAAVTSEQTDFLPGANKDEKLKPLCQGDNRKVIWTGNKYSLTKFESTECETACTDANQEIWLKATGDESSLKCRVLDVQEFPLHRRGLRPLARLMDINDIFKMKFLDKAADNDSGREFIASYPFPVDYLQIKDETMRKDVMENLWLNEKTNPFSRKYGSYIKTLAVNDCEEDALDFQLCNKKEKGPPDGDKDLVSVMLRICALFVICCDLLIVAIYCITTKKAKKIMATSEEAKSGNAVNSTEKDVSPTGPAFP